MAKFQFGPGAVLDGFLIGQRVHKGGMAVLYEVTHTGHNIPMLMKVPVISAGDDPAAIVGFEMEQMILPRLEGPHTPRFIALGDFAIQPYLVFERILGKTLFNRLPDLPLQSAEVADIGVKTATALHALHSQHVIHLDIKPSNIILRPPGNDAVLIDYGLSHHDQLPDLIAEEFRLPYGTAPYMAPEQVFGIRTDPRSDLFALGALLYFFATGKRPFGDPQTLKGLKRRVWRDPIPPRQLRPDLPSWLQEIILRCLASDPEVRHPTAAQLAFELSHSEQIKLTWRATKLRRAPWTEVLKRRFHPDSYRPILQREQRIAARLASAPIIAVAIELGECHPDMLEALRVTVGRILKTVPGARLACLNVMRINVIAADAMLDAEGHSIHVQRIVQLSDWARTINIPTERITYHVLEAVDAGAAILGYLTANNVDHVVIGATTRSRLRNILGSVASEIIQKAPCTVTIVRRPRSISTEIDATVDTA